jgi:uncharacterized protein (TIGR04255 family)
MTTYPTNFVSKVIARVDFQPILKLKQEPVDFQEIIREQFPRFSQKESLDISIKPGEVPVPTKIPTWQFISKEKTNQISLNYQTITLIMNKYDNFESFFFKNRIDV